MCINSKHEIGFTKGERVRIRLRAIFPKGTPILRILQVESNPPKRKRPFTIIVRSLEVQKSILSAITKKGIDSTFAPGQTELCVQLYHKDHDKMQFKYYDMKLI